MLLPAFTETIHLVPSSSAAEEKFDAETPAEAEAEKKKLELQLEAMMQRIDIKK